MRFLFLTDSTDPGRSGVGDYTLQLAQQLQYLGLDARVECFGIEGSATRATLVDRVLSHRADWISHQFVPYSLSPRGFVGPHTLPWRQLRGTVGTHFMFHEIWIGGSQGASFRDRLIGSTQRRGIRKILPLLQPNRVHCSNPLYQAMLSRVGIQARVLPLFGSVPIASNPNDPYFFLIEGFAPLSSRDNWLVLAFFGNLYPCANLTAAISWLHSLSARQGKSLLVVSLGHSSAAHSTFEQLSSHHNASNIKFFIKGPIDTSSLSPWLQCADLAFSTTPYNIIQKSSSAVAFAEHGVPVVVVDPGTPIRSLPFTPSDLSPDYWLFGDPRLNPPNCLPPHRPPMARLPHVAAQLLADLAA